MLSESAKLIEEARRHVWDAINCLQRSGAAITFARELNQLDVIEDRLWQYVDDARKR